MFPETSKLIADMRAAGDENGARHLEAAAAELRRQVAALERDSRGTLEARQAKRAGQVA